MAENPHYLLPFIQVTCVVSTRGEGGSSTKGHQDYYLLLGYETREPIEGAAEKHLGLPDNTEALI